MSEAGGGLAARRHLPLALAIAGAVLAILLLRASPAPAHGLLARSEPAGGSVVAAAPQALRLTFTQRPLVEVSQVSVYGEDGRRLPGTLRAAPGDPRTLVVRLQPVDPMEPGLYTVVWRITSAADGHDTLGAFTFRVGGLAGRPLALEPAARPGAAAPFVRRVVLRWMALAGAVVLAGGALAQAVLLFRHRADWALAARRRMALAGIGAALLLAGATAAGAALQDIEPVGQTGRPVDIFPGPQALRLGASAALALVLWPAARLGRAGRAVPLVFILATVLWLGFSISGHAAAAGPLAVAMEVVHLHAIGIWIGGLFYLHAVVRPVLRRVAPESLAEQIAPLARRFSAVAVVAVAAVAVSGVYATVLHVPAVREAVSSPYGRALAAKLILFAVLVCLGGVNRFRVLPSMLRDRVRAHGQATGHAAARFAQVVGAEIAVGAAVLALAVVLALVPTARQVLAEAEGRPGGLRLAGILGEGLVATLTVTPFSVGENTFEVSLHPPDRVPVGRARVQLRFLFLEEDRRVVTAVAAEQAPGRFVYRGGAMGRPGLWMLEVALRRPGVEDAVVAFPVDPGPPRLAGLEADSEPRAAVALRASLAAMREVRSLRVLEHLTDGLGNQVATRLEFVRPDRLRVQTTGAPASVVVGANRYIQQDGRWVLAGRTAPVDIDTLLYADDPREVRGGLRHETDGGAAQVITYGVPGYNARFAVWIDPKTKRVLRQAMLAEAHHMVRWFSDFNAPVRIPTPVR